jgi:hypothetical protein
MAREALGLFEVIHSHRAWGTAVKREIVDSMGASGIERLRNSV